MAETPKGRRSRRQFDDDFKAQAVRLVLDEGKSVGAVARDLDLTETALRAWVKRARADRTHGRTGLTTAEREELARLRKENRQLRLEREILKNAGGLLRERTSDTFALIHARKALFPIATMCDVLGVSASGYYAWSRRPESAHAQRDRQVRVLVRASFDASKHRYGSPRIHEELREQDVRVSRKRVIRLMQEEGLKARARKRFKCTTMSDHDQPVAANLLDREFTADAPNRRWVGDTTEFVIGESGKLYLAAILDLFSRFVVGWAVSAVNDRHLALNALTMALNRRCPDIGLLHHSDQGCTYASEDYQRRLEAHGITCSMSRKGNCYDNAVMEAFFSTVKSELADRFESCGHAKMELFEYLEAFYNQRRRHSTIGYVSPAVFEHRTRSGSTNERCA
ncbi:MAG TPA: IS3 family transposase [Vicinamibacterales bacterium]|nr:IS3 family transposase [Vicinamibacterales bacterium]